MLKKWLNFLLLVIGVCGSLTLLSDGLTKGPRLMEEFLSFLIRLSGLDIKSSLNLLILLYAGSVICLFLGLDMLLYRCKRPKPKRLARLSKERMDVIKNS